MLTLRTPILLSAMGLLIAAPAFGQAKADVTNGAKAIVEPAALQEVPAPAAVRAFFAKNPQMLEGAKFFRAPGGLIGAYVPLKDGSKPSILYFSADGSAMFAGIVMDLKTNTNLTALAATQFAPDTKLGLTGAALLRQGAAFAPAADDNPVPTANATPTSLAKLNFVETGTGARVVYAFVDPTCVHCQTAFNEITAWQSKGNAIKVRWVPIALGADRATALAAATLAGDRTADGLRRMFADKVDGVTKEKATQGATALAENMVFAQDSIPISATPTFVYVDHGKVTTRSGYAGVNAFAAGGTL